MDHTCRFINHQAIRIVLSLIFHFSGSS